MKSGIVNQDDMIRFSEKIYKEASRLITLIEDIIKLSKLDEQDTIMEEENLDLYELCLDICNRLTFQAVKRNVLIEMTGENVKYTGVKQILDEMNITR